AVVLVAFSPDGKVLAAGSWRSDDEQQLHGEVKLWDLATGKERATIPEPFPVLRALAFSPDGKKLAAAGSEELAGANKLKLLDVATGRVDVAIPVKPGRWVRGLAFSPDGRYLAASTDKIVRVWEVKARNQD